MSEYGPALDYDGTPFDIDDLVGEEVDDGLDLGIDYDAFEVEADADSTSTLMLLADEAYHDSMQGTVHLVPVETTDADGPFLFTARRWAPAACIDALLGEVNRRWPRRDRTSDGILGDAAHSSRDSDHNPDERGIVHAVDVDKDGLDVKVLLAALIGDQRVWYVIFDRVIYSRTYGWRPRRYTGANPHTGHVHASIRYGTAWERDTSAWFATSGTRPAKTTGGQTPTNTRVVDVEALRRQFSLAKAGKTVQKRSDVAAVQKMLNKRPRQKAGKALRITGRVDPETLAAWRGYEKATAGSDNVMPSKGEVRLLFRDSRVKTRLA